MRDKKEILNTTYQLFRDGDSEKQALILEVLIDIRDVLAKGSVVSHDNQYKENQENKEGECFKCGMPTDKQGNCRNGDCVD